MDVEVGVITDEAVQGDGRIRAGVLPAAEQPAERRCPLQP
jgi:hypothetical protein